jgi:hypothetical protein
MGGSSTPSKTTQTQELPAWAQPTSQQLLARGTALSNQAVPVYQGQRTADLNGTQQQGIDMITDRATNGDANLNAGAQNLQSTLNGTYLDGGNPYLQSQINQASQGLVKNYQDTVGATDATFARNGAFGGSAWNQANANNSTALASGLGNLASSMQYANYNDERNRQQSAQTTALQYGNQAYTDANNLLTAGGQQYNITQQQMQDAMNKFNEQAQSPYKQLDVLANTLSGAIGNGGTITQSAPGANPYAQALGGGAALAGLLGGS